MRIGIVTPVVVQLPGSHDEWEREAGIDQLALIAATADRLGFHHLTCSEHVAVPAEDAAQRGGTYWDPLATFGNLAAHTGRIRLATQVVVLGYHHPLAIAKRYGTLDRLSGGRLVLGVGVGSLRAEFDLLGAPFDDRGARADEAMRALRACLSAREVAFHGEFYDFDDVVVEPHAVQDEVPMWVGGRTRRSLRRALTHGNGWVPFGLPLAEISALLARADLPAGFDVVLGPNRALDPIGAAASAARALDRLREAGATVAGVRITAASAEHYCEQLAALREIGRERGIPFDDARSDGTR
ncbi:LLM class F420-dependent oxidoreductase [Saccharopolyspora sp. SCSIO 74807]|uniref:LLM class F420-dependent oxidoreductase n=1 Tax=Saccharopolyspora sp. SCSIO 74807 TaxID=3118084 RepID=UPI0030CCDA50